MGTEVSDALVTVGSCGGVFYAFDVEDGAVRWSYDTRTDAGPAQFHGDPAVVGELLVTGSDTARPPFLYAFDADGGALRWKSSGHVIESGVVVVGDTAFGASSTGEVLAVAVDDGALRWRHEPESMECDRRPRTPASDGEALYAATPDGRVTAFDLEDGTVRWSQPTGCVTTDLALLGGRLWLGTEGTVRLLSPADGDTLATVEDVGYPHGAFVAADEETVVVQADGSKVLGLEHDGELRWSVPSDVELSSPRPHALGGLVLVGRDDGLLWALDPATGEVVWETTVDGVVRGIGSGFGRLFVGTLDGTLFSVEAPEG